MSNDIRKLGILAFGGYLPLMLVRHALEIGTEFFVICFDGITDIEPMREMTSALCVIKVTELHKLIQLLHKNVCQDVVMAGYIQRPSWRTIRLSWRDAPYLWRLIRASFQGDDGLLRQCICFFEEQKIRVVGIEDVAPALLLSSGCLSTLQPSEIDRSDIQKAKCILQDLSAHDIGQAIVVANGVVVAIEALEGTDAMLQRVQSLSARWQHKNRKRQGVLVKMSKIGQDRRVDLPALGDKTLSAVSTIGLSGVAYEANSVLGVNIELMLKIAQQEKLFLTSIQEI